MKNILRYLNQHLSVFTAAFILLAGAASVDWGYFIL
jgi:hypothetical protein